MTTTDHSLRQEPADSIYEAVEWNCRKATRLTNGVVELLLLTGGGHVASFRLIEKDAGYSPNVLWEASWRTLDPPLDWSEELSRLYGSEEMGRFLASFTGHAVCLDYFGLPAADMISRGLSLHGEAAITNWETQDASSSEGVGYRGNVNLSSSNLTFERTIRLGRYESVAYVQEKVINHRDEDHLCDWVQHVTLGAPFLRPGESTLTSSAKRGITGHSYERATWLAANSEFVWPHAPQAATIGGVTNLEQPFRIHGQGFILGVQLDPEREHEFFLATNQTTGLGVGYVFRRRDFAWMAIWEENCARLDPPWKGTTVARGMEFGTSPLPIGEQDKSERRSAFGIPTGCLVPACREKEARYLMFLFRVVPHHQRVADVAVSNDTIVLYNEDAEEMVSIAANGCEAFLAEQGTCQKPHQERTVQRRSRS